MITLSGLAISLTSLSLLAPPADRAPIEGWRFTWKVTTESDARGGAAAQAAPSMTVSLIPGKARMDVRGDAASRQGMMKKGGYMVLDAERGTITVVSPEDRSAFVMDPGGLGNALGAVGATGLVKMDVSDVQVNVEKLGTGERILGRATTKYRITRSHRMSVSVFGRKSTTTHQSVTEAWMTDDFLGDKAFEAWARNFARGMQAAGDAFNKLIEAEERAAPKGIPLRQIQKSTDTDDKGQVTTSTVSMEMEELQKTDLDAAAFEVPAGYTVTDMKQQMAELSKAMEEAHAECEAKHGKGSEACDVSQNPALSMDSITAAMKEGVREGAREGAKEAAKDATKSAIKGIFRKKR